MAVKYGSLTRFSRIEKALNKQKTCTHRSWPVFAPIGFESGATVSQFPEAYKPHKITVV